MERIKLAIEKARQQASHDPSFHGSQIARPSTLHGAQGPASTGLQDLGIPIDLTPLDPVHLERHRVVTLEQNNPFRRDFDLLRTQVLHKMQEHGWRTIAITSPSVQSGKTVVAVNLALSIAHHPSRTALLVDFDLRRPNVATCLGLPQRTSLNEVFTGEAQLQDAIVHAGIPKFLVLPTHRRVAGAAEMLSSDRVSTIMSSLRDNYPERIVVLDLPPVTAVDDTIALLPKVDCVLLVVGNGNSTKREIEESQRHLARFNLLGVVVNKAAGAIRNGEYY